MPRYTSKHTGKKIDDTIDSVVNPNLLDNWYFGNPVDQRGGYVAVPGISYYDKWGGQATGVTDKYYTAIHTPGGYDDQYQITVNGAVKYVSIADCVRGYTGSMHTIDRWAIYGYTSGAIALTHNGINISGSFDFGTVIEMSRMPDDSPITASFLFTDGFYSFTVANKYTFGAAQIDSGGAQCVWLPNWPNADSGTGLFFVNGNAFPSINRTFIAAKLELGDTQTLAHQDENGNWVLNEIPDYGEQLARCQRYLLDSRESGNENSYSGIATETWLLVTNVVFPEVMREIPGVKLYNHSAVDHVRRIADNADLSLPASMVVSRTKNGVTFIYEPSHADTFIKGAAYDFNVVANAEL